MASPVKSRKNQRCSPKPSMSWNRLRNAVQLGSRDSGATTPLRIRGVERARRRAGIGGAPVGRAISEQRVAAPAAQQIPRRACFSAAASSARQRVERAQATVSRCQQAPAAACERRDVRGSRARSPMRRTEGPAHRRDTSQCGAATAVAADRGRRGRVRRAESRTARRWCRADPHPHLRAQRRCRGRSSPETAPRASLAPRRGMQARPAR